MRAVAQIVGVVWMAACLVALVWLGFALPLPRPDISPFMMPSIIHDSQYGLSAVAFVGVGVGFLVWRWGKGEQADSRQP